MTQTPPRKKRTMIKGTYGFRINQKDHLTINLKDSDFLYLGRNMVQEIHNVLDAKRLQEYKNKAQNMLFLTDQTEVVSEHVDACIENKIIFPEDRNKDFTSFTLLQNAQGSLIKFLDTGLMFTQNDFIMHSGNCEYGYIWNFDKDVLEVYAGKQFHPHKNGRFARRQNSPTKIIKGSGLTIYPCALLKTFPFDSIPGDWAVECLKVQLIRTFRRKNNNYFPEYNQERINTIWKRYEESLGI